MTEQVSKEKRQEIKEKLVYQRAIYRIHECDDPELKKYFQSIIYEYEHKHMKKEDPRQQLLPGFLKAFDSRGLSK